MATKWLQSRCVHASLNGRFAVYVSVCRAFGTLNRRREKVWLVLRCFVFVTEKAADAHRPACASVLLLLSSAFCCSEQGTVKQWCICEMTVFAPSHNHSPWLESASLDFFVWLRVVGIILELTWDGSKLGHCDFTDFDSKASTGWDGSAPRFLQLLQEWHCWCTESKCPQLGAAVSFPYPAHAKRSLPLLWV